MATKKISSMAFAKASRRAGGSLSRVEVVIGVNGEYLSERIGNEWCPGEKIIARTTRPLTRAEAKERLEAGRSNH